MALLIGSEPQTVGVALFIPPSWRQGYFWHAGMEEAQFCDSPKQLANDIVWITNVPFEITKTWNAPYIKHHRFFRTPVQRLLFELNIADKTLPEQAIVLGKILQRLENSPERDHLRLAESLHSAMVGVLPSNANKAATLMWQQLAQEARKWYWKGATKHQFLMGASLYAPRYDLAKQIIKCPVPDFSKDPKIIKGDFKGLVLHNLLKDHAGFVRVRIENVNRSVQEFIDLSRTLVTTYEALWLMRHADVSAKYLYLTDYIQHPADSKQLPAGPYKPYSWLDSLRLESLALSPTYKNIAMDAHIRGIAHLSMAYYAEYLSKVKGLAPIALSYGKIGLAFSRQEEQNVRKTARECGLLFALAEEEGLDLTIGTGA